MDNYNLLYLVYGMCLMFHLMMGWVFCFRKNGLAKKLIGALMFLVVLQYFKDLFMLQGFYGEGAYAERVASSIDVVTVPLYVLILVEFCRPHWLNMRRIVVSELPFILLSLLYVLTRYALFYHLMMSLALIYGVLCALWTIRELPVYHRRLKEEYSYDEDINLHWLRGVTLLFFVILLLWIYSNAKPCPESDTLYMLSSLVGWSVTCYFINKQELVLREVMGNESLLELPGDEKYEITAESDEQVCDDVVENLQNSIRSLFENDKVYLDPKLRLSELAVRLGTNRTYLSQYFNQSCEQSFYAYVNRYRVSHSMHLLLTTDYTIETVALMSGFNSISTFRRAFLSQNGCSPLQYRNNTPEKPG